MLRPVAFNASGHARATHLPYPNAAHSRPPWDCHAPVGKGLSVQIVVTPTRLDTWHMPVDPGRCVSALKTWVNVVPKACMPLGNEILSGDQGTCDICPDQTNGPTVVIIHSHLKTAQPSYRMVLQAKFLRNIWVADSQHCATFSLIPQEVSLRTCRCQAHRQGWRETRLSQWYAARGERT
jgi:hypothetical protein